MSIRLGKDVLDLVSGAMYIEPLTLYRELIQNSTDSIDLRYRRNAGKDGRIIVTLDRPNRTVIVDDNGVGIKQGSAGRVLTSIGESEKRGTDARGFRGVGRLAGLGYCKNLRFEAKAPGEVKKTVVEWDGVKFRQKIKDPEYKKDLATLVEEITSIEKVFSERKKGDGFFRVSLIGVVRLPLDRLLNEEKIASYVSQHCPVPFSDDFSQKDEVEIFLRQHSNYKSYQVFLKQDLGNEESKLEQPLQQVFRPFGSAIGDVPIKDATLGTDLIETNHGVNAIWHIDHELIGAISKSQGIRGLRARQKNIQVGEENIFAELFKEPRFNSWVCGEVHVGDPTILPNGRRDSFEPSPSFNQLETSLHEIAHRLSSKCRSDSKLRNYEHKVDSDLFSLSEVVGALSKTTVPTDVVDNIVGGISNQLTGLEHRIKSGDSLQTARRKRKISTLKKNLMKVTSAKLPLARKSNGYIDSAVLNAIFEEVISSTSDKIKAVQIIVSSINKIDRLRQNRGKSSL